METVHALVDVPSGRELTISYLPKRGFERATRRAQLREEHGFECCCARCELTGVALAASEARQRAIGELLRPGDGALPAAKLVRLVETRLSLMGTEGMPRLWAWKPLVYYLVKATMEELARDPSAEAPRKRAAAWAKSAFEDLRKGLGSDHPASELVFSLLLRIVGQDR